MDFWQWLRVQGGQGEQLQRWEVLFALFLSAICVWAVCLVYRYTHKSATYNQSYVHNLMLMGLVTTLIMIVIGSNIARAFSLVGALSIVRFRNAIKESRDVGYIFFTMAVAMACGTRFYVVALLATCVISIVMCLLYLTDFGRSPIPPERLLTIHLPGGVDPDERLGPALRDLFHSFTLVSLESIKQGIQAQAVYSVQPKPGLKPAQVLEALGKLNENLKVTYHVAAPADDQ